MQGNQPNPPEPGSPAAGPSGQDDRNQRYWFHILAQNTHAARNLHAAKLVDKAWQQGDRVCVLCDTEEQAVNYANNTPYGLAAYFYTENSARTFRVSRALEYGMVGINVGVFSNEVGPFGGVKQSGLGREGSVWGIEEFLEMKYLCIGTL